MNPRSSKHDLVLHRQSCLRSSHASCKAEKNARLMHRGNLGKWSASSCPLRFSMSWFLLRFLQIWRNHTRFAAVACHQRVLWWVVQHQCYMCSLNRTTCSLHSAVNAKHWKPLCATKNERATILCPLLSIALICAYNHVVPTRPILQSSKLNCSTFGHGGHVSGFATFATSRMRYV